jgi:hypothetical protein
MLRKSTYFFDTNKGPIKMTVDTCIIAIKHFVTSPLSKYGAMHV